MAYMREQRNNRKIENAVKAERHTKLMQDKYKDQIQASMILCQEKVQIKNDFFPSCQHT